MQGSVPVADRESGRSSQGYWCNMEKVGVYGPDDPQGFEGAEWQFARYKDSAGRQCGYYSQRMFGSLASSMTIRSTPGASPPCGGAP